MKKLLKALEQIKTPGTFCTSGEVPSCFLGLAVDKVGPIGLPLSKEQAKKIIKQSLALQTSLPNIWLYTT